MRMLFIIMSIFAVIGVITQAAWAADDIGSVVAVRGRAAISRNGKSFDAKVKDGIFLIDTVSTREASRVKMLFIDDSVLTLGEKSTVVIREFIYGKDKGNKSLFNLIEGKMRSVVGRAGFEARTPTAVAAARGTIILFEAGVRSGKKFTTILCLESFVDVSKADAGDAGHVTLKAGEIITLIEGEPLPHATLATLAEKERMLKDTDVADHEISIPGPMSLDLNWEGLSYWKWRENMDPPPLANQPPVQRTTPVTIEPIFPKR